VRTTSPPAISATSAAFSALLLVLLAVLVPFSALSAWVDLEVDDTDRYVAAVSPLASDPAVRSTVADLVTEEAMRQIDLGPLQDTVRDFLHETVGSFTTTEAFRNAWDTANRAAHKAVAAALDGDSGEAVTIDLAPVIDQVKQDLVRDGVPFADQIPVERTEITVLGPGQADDLRNSFRWLRYCSIWPTVATLVLLVLVVGIATVRRGLRAGLWTTATVGAGLVLGAVVLRVLVAAGRGRVLDEVPGSDRDTAAAVFDALTASLRTTVWVVLAVGVVLLVGAVAARVLLRRRKSPAGMR
jgi:NADH:ubiquinone oxidoreductase subunit 6 (subunit J)